MKNYLAEVFIDDRPILNDVVQANQPQTAMMKVLRTATKDKMLKYHRPTKYVVRLTKIK